MRSIPERIQAIMLEAGFPGRVLASTTQDGQLLCGWVHANGLRCPNTIAAVVGQRISEDDYVATAARLFLRKLSPEYERQLRDLVAKQAASAP